jgi:hypothetical protein
LGAYKCSPAEEFLITKNFEYLGLGEASMYLDDAGIEIQGFIKNDSSVLGLSEMLRKIHILYMLGAVSMGLCLFALLCQFIKAFPRRLLGLLFNFNSIFLNRFLEFFLRKYRPTRIFRLE